MIGCRIWVLAANVATKISWSVPGAAALIDLALTSKLQRCDLRWLQMMALAPVQQVESVPPYREREWRTKGYCWVRPRHRICCSVHSQTRRVSGRAGGRLLDLTVENRIGNVFILLQCAPRQLRKVYKWNAHQMESFSLLMPFMKRPWLQSW